MEERLNDRVKELKELAHNIRRDVLTMTYESGANGGHLGGGLSCADILAVLYGRVMKINKNNPVDEDRDRFILSKGHTSLAHYAALAECGLLPKDALAQFEKPGSRYSTHEEIEVEKGIEISSGSLGYGPGIGVGCALGMKRKGNTNRVFVLVGDGECNEGAIWEAIMSAVQFQLDNLYIIIDLNELQLDGYTIDIMPMKDPAMIFRGFGCRVEEVDGNDVDKLVELFEHILCEEKEEQTDYTKRPTIILAHTKKSKGIASIEGENGWHHARLSEEQYQSFLEELEGKSVD